MEVIGLLAACGLLFVIPVDTPAFRLTLCAFVALLLMHAIFWIFTQPVNRFWMRGQTLSGAGAVSRLLISGNTVNNNGQFDGVNVNTPDSGTSPNFSVTVTNNHVTTAASGVNGSPS